MSDTYYPDDRNKSLLPIYAVTVGINHSQEAVNRPNGAFIHHILFVQDGEGIFETETNRYLLKKNTAVFIEKASPIKYSANTNNFITAWITFDGECVKKLLEYFNADSFSFCNGENLFPRLQSCVALTQKGTSAATVSKEIYDIVISYFNELNISLCPRPLIAAKQFINENYDRDISIDDISAAAEISPSFLFRLFKEKEKCTPIEYLKYSRIEKAKLLLITNTSDTVENIGKTCGFSNSAYFCKVFKSETGVTPNTFRDSYRI